MRSHFHRLPLQAAAVLAISAIAFGVQAQSAAPAKDTAVSTPVESAASLFKRIDTNQDGKISREEAARLPGVAERFDQLDKNKDGVLSADEFSAAIEAPKQ